MKKILCCLLAVLLLAACCACGKNADADASAPTADPVSTPEATPAAEPQPTPEADTGTDEQTPEPGAQPDESAPEETQPPAETDLAAFVGSWHDAIAGRAGMTVTMYDGGLQFEVIWPDSAFAYYEFSFLAAPDGAGGLHYESGYKGRVEYTEDAEDGESTRTVVDDAAAGTVRLTEDGSILWTEDAQPDNPHEFVRDEIGAEIDLAAFVGSWHDAIAGRAGMTVSMYDGGLQFEVIWPDSAFAYYEYHFCAVPDGMGGLCYDGGFKGVVETDAEGNETKTILDDAAAGTVRLTEDGSILWTEDAQPDNPHEFVPD